MKWNLYDDTIEKWGEIVIKPVLDAHVETKATDTEFGHVKIDGNTLVIGDNGELKVNEVIADTYTPTVYFNIGEKITTGRIENAYFYTPFNCKIKSFNVSLVNLSTEVIDLNIQKTTNFVTYVDVLSNDLQVNANTHVQSFKITEDVELVLGDLLFVDIKQSDGEASNMLITMTIEKI